MLIDTHAHLQLNPLFENYEVVLNKAVKNGVHKLIIPSVNLDSSRKSLSVAIEHPESCFCAVGIHPQEISELLKNNELSEISVLNLFAQLEKLYEENQNSIIAIGEIGLDYYYFEKEGWNEEQIVLLKKYQKLLFIKLANLALANELPIIIHSRSSVTDTISVLTDLISNSPKFTAVLHCCEADDSLLEFAIKHNIFIGVDGDVTFSKKKKRFAKNVPLELLLLETDSPYLTPKPLRDIENTKWPNTPANLPIIAQYIANLHDSDLENIAKISSNNAQRCFRI